MVGFTPGGGVDINARLLGPKLTEFLGQAVIVENRPGAGTNIANELVAKSPPDGYTLLINTAAVAINLSLYKKVAFEARDFAPVSVLSMSPNILVVHASVPVRTVKELVALSRPARASSTSPRPEPAPRSTWRASFSIFAPVRRWCTCRTRAAHRRSPRSSAGKSN